MKQHSFLSVLLLLCFLPGLGFAQKHVITRPTAKPKTTQKAQPKKTQSPKKPTQRQDTGMPEAERRKILDNLISNMVYVEGGTFMMGATPEQGDDAYDDEKPAHQVTLSGFYIGRYEVTQREWRAVMGINPSERKGDDLPVEMVGWEECVDFISRLNRLTGRNFRLPTEAEWEYAARGGNESRGYKYAGSNNNKDVAWYGWNSDPTIHTNPVGTKQPNELGLYDMSGNVSEWCQDWYGSYSPSAQTNPVGPSTGTKRVIRGGSWWLRAQECRVSYRYSRGPYSPDRNRETGFRLAL